MNFNSTFFQPTPLSSVEACSKRDHDGKKIHWMATLLSAVLMAAQLAPSPGFLTFFISRIHGITLLRRTPASPTSAAMSCLANDFFGKIYWHERRRTKAIIIIIHRRKEVDVQNARAREFEEIGTGRGEGKTKKKKSNTGPVKGVSSSCY